MQEGGGPDHPRASEASGDHMSDDAKSTGAPIHPRPLRVRRSMLVLLLEHDFVHDFVDGRVATIVPMIMLQSRHDFLLMKTHFFRAAGRKTGTITAPIFLPARSVASVPHRDSRGVEGRAGFHIRRLTCDSR